MTLYEKMDKLDSLSRQYKVNPLYLYAYVTELAFDGPRGAQIFHKNFGINPESYKALRYEQARAEYFRGLPNTAA